MYCWGPNGSFLILLLTLSTGFITFGIISLDSILEFNEEYKLRGCCSVAIIVTLVPGVMVTFVGVCMPAGVIFVIYNGAKSQDPNSEHTFWTNLKQYIEALIKGTEEDTLGKMGETIKHDLEAQAFEIDLKENESTFFDPRPESNKIEHKTDIEGCALKKEGFDGNNTSCPQAMNAKAKQAAM